MKEIDKFLYYFEDESAYTDVRENKYKEPWVSIVAESSDRVNYNKPMEEKAIILPLRFNILSDGTIKWLATNTSATKTIEYRLNGGGWTSITSNTGSLAPTISVSEGDIVEFRGNNGAYGNSSAQSTFSGTTAEFEVLCNIMSLIDSTGYATAATISNYYTFSGLFKGCDTLVSAKMLKLPATTLVNDCYTNMFAGCTSLTTAPELPATTLGYECYKSMFSGCTSLTTAPELPATMLNGSNNVYTSMFAGCTSLTTAPELPATTLSNECYHDMFSGCTSLTSAPALPATSLTSACYSGMFQHCTSLTTVPELPATSLKSDCYSSMFMGCTSLTAAPELPATTLTGSCYAYMFSGCTALTTAPELPATTLKITCYMSMFKDCTSLNYIKCLATNISATSCTYQWVDGVNSSGTFVKNPNMTNWTTGANGIPNNWTVQDAS